MLSIFAVLANRSLAFNVLVFTSQQYIGETSEGRSPLPFFLNKKRETLTFGKKCPDCFHLHFTQCHKQCQAENQTKSEFLLFENYSLSSFTLSMKNNRRYSKKDTKNKYLCLNEVIWLMTLKWGWKWRADHIDQT